jgi:hypothetical protein
MPPADRIEIFMVESCICRNDDSQCYFSFCFCFFKFLFNSSLSTMNAHVFELLSESNDPDQFDITWQAIRRYVEERYEYADDMRFYFQQPIETPHIDLPLGCTTRPTRQQIRNWEYATTQCNDRVKVLRRNQRALYILIWDKCSKKLQIRLNGRSHGLAAKKYNIIWLVKNLRTMIPSFDPNRDIFASLHEARLALLTCRQYASQSNEDYFECYIGCVEVLDHFHSTVGEHYSLIESKDENGNLLTTEQRKIIARDRSLAVGFLRGADEKRYRCLLEWLKFGKHPPTLAMAYEWLNNYQRC